MSPIAQETKYGSTHGPTQGNKFYNRSMKSWLQENGKER